VDTIAPGIVDIDGTPTDTLTVDEVPLSFSTGDPDDTFRCSLDGDDYEACDADEMFDDLSDGAHTLNVVAVDAAGNVGPIAATAFVVNVDHGSGGGTTEPEEEPEVPATEETPIDAVVLPIPEPEPEPENTPSETDSRRHNESGSKPADGKLGDGDGGGTADTAPEQNAGAPAESPAQSAEETHSSGIAPVENLLTSLHIPYHKGKQRDAKQDGRSGEEKSSNGKAAAAERKRMRLRNEGDKAEEGRLPQLLVFAKKTVETLAFPFALTILVVLYLMTQYWIDRADPKLAIAPMNAKYDVVRFE
jgi:hypothetical protein